MSRTIRFCPHPSGYYASYDLIECFDKLVNQMIKGWQYHFEMLNLTYLAYLMFADVARKLFPGISESAIGKMVAGAYVSMFRPEEELCRLSRLAVSSNAVADILKSTKSAAEKIAELQQYRKERIGWQNMTKPKTPGFMFPAAAVGIIMKAVGSPIRTFPIAISKGMWKGCKREKPSNAPWM